MSTRTARVVLELMADKFISNAKKSSQAMRDVGDEAEKAGKKADKAGEQGSQSTKQHSDALKKLAQSHHDAATAAGLQYNRAGQLIDSNGKMLTSAQAATKGLDAFSGAVYEMGEDAERAAEKQRQAADAAEAYGNKQAAAAEKAGTALVAFGAGTVAALGASAKAAMDWESAWAGVTKTVDGSPEQMRELETGLRDLAKTLPSTHTEIAAVAEAAGQLGVKRKDIISFTKTMIDLGETTNLTAEEAATDIAQIANVMGTTGDEIDNFGAALVALGNDGASTEKDILSMAQRIAGAGKLVGASEADVLALSNTLASMGVKAELGGGVATRALLKMYAAVQSGGPKLDAFASAAGVSASTFADAFRTSPVAALEMVTKGMARVKDEGGNVVQVLKDMGLKGTEEMQVMLALAGAGDLLSESLELGTQAWEENIALVEEATKRYSTTESKVKVAWNNIKDAAIDAGAVMLPVIAGIAENVSGLAESFGNLPAPLQGAITGLGGVVGAAALAGGGLMLLLPKVRDGIDAFKTLNTRADGSSRGLGKFGKAAGVAAGAFVGFEILKSVHNSMQTGAKSTEEFSLALIRMGKHKDGLDDAFRDIGVKEFEGEIGSAGQALDKLINQNFNSAIESFGATALGVDNGMAKISNAFDKLDQSTAGLADSGNLEVAARGFKSVADSAAEQGISIEKVGEKFPNYLNALRQMAVDAEQSVSPTELLAWAMGEVPPQMQAVADKASAAAEGVIQVKGAAGQAIPITEEMAKALEEVGLNADGSVASIDKFTQALLNTGLLQLSARDAARGWSQALLDLGLNADGTGGSIGALGTEFDNTTEAGIRNQAMFDGVAQAGINNVKTMAQVRDSNGQLKHSNEDVQGALQGTYNGLVNAAGQFGITGQAAIDLARDVLGVPDGVSIESWMSSEALRMAQATTGELNNIDGRNVKATMTLVEHRIKILETQVRGGGYADDPSMTALDPSNYAEGGAIQRRADGGRITGPGTSTSDEVPIMASAGEHMLDRGDVIRMGGHDAVYQFRRDPKAWAAQHLAGGGAVGRTVDARSLTGHQTVVQAPAAPEIDYQALARAIGSQPIQNELYMDGRKLYGWIKQAPSKYRDG